MTKNLGKKHADEIVLEVFERDDGVFVSVLTECRPSETFSKLIFAGIFTRKIP